VFGSDSVTAVYLVRHATPDWSRTELRYDIPPGPPLINQGEAEAGQLGAFLRQAGVQRIYASPLERARRTAEIAAQVANATVEEIVAIAEWQRGEGDVAVLDRLLPFWAMVCAESSEPEPLALVTHGGPIRLLLQHLKLDQNEIDFYRKQFDRDNPLPPAGAWRVSRAHVDAPWRFELRFTPQPFQPYAPPTLFV
jgi:broad specificity phosphatase PhoE